MELRENIPASTSDILTSDEVDIRFDIFNLLKEMNLSVTKAIALLELTKNEIQRQATEEMKNMKI